MSKRSRFLDGLPPESEDLLPVLYRTVTTAPNSTLRVVRLAESRSYRAAGYECFPFHRPISKLLRREEASKSKK
jgi:hypothetical protein